MSSNRKHQQNLETATIARERRVGRVVRGGAVQYKAELQLRFSRLSILHISPLLKTIQLSQFLSELQL